MVLRPATEADVAALVAILAEPAVARWWGANDAAAVRAALAFSRVIEVAGATAGVLHVHEEADPEFPSVAFDIALGEGFRGRGLGAQALRVAIREHVARGHHRFTIDPAADNAAAIRSYAAIGFRPVGILRQAERLAGGGFRDALLMDLLAAELIEGEVE